jgi:hypothetical protein
MINVLRRIIPEKFHRRNLPKSIIRMKCKDAVYSGPFKGMRYVPYSICSAYYPKLLGTYEKELHHFIFDFIAREFKNIVNVGAGEGYYACGMALKSQESFITVFEQNADGRKAIKQMAEINSLSERIKIKGYCDKTILKNELHDKENLLIVDIEGGEIEILNPGEIPTLKKQSILVELHDTESLDITNIITNRFNATHFLSEISSVPRTVDDYPFRINSIFKSYCGDVFQMFIHERPKIMRWLIMEPKESYPLGQPQS